ncbi:DsbA family protein [Methylobacterium sp.]|uniref:DsbA family protein n=1 Tax=Methylobacterium sp. TaxID=409 RepID=UPI003C766FA4
MVNKKSYQLSRRLNKSHYNQYIVLFRRWLKSTLRQGALGIIVMVSAIVAAPYGAQAENAGNEVNYSDEFGKNVRSYLLNNPDVILEVFSILENKEKDKKAQISHDLIGQYENQIFTGGDARKGAETPAVTFVEFFDYRCTYCKRVFPEVSALLDNRADVAVVMKEFPILGPQSEAASRTALAVRALHGDAAYLKIHDAFMGHTGEFTDRDLARLVETAGFDPIAVQFRSQGDDIAEVIRANRSLAAKLGINGTPAFVFEDSIAPGMMSYEQIVSKVDRIALKKSTQ